MSNTIISKAAQVAERAHASIDQRRKYTNEPYIVHPRSVAAIVSSVTVEASMICAAWLHDVVEDTPVSLDEIKVEFGVTVADLVDELTDVSRPTDGKRATRVAIDRAHTAQASPQGKTIKLADVIDNLSGIERADIHFARKYIREKEHLLDVLGEGDQTLFKRAAKLIKSCKLKLID